MFWARTAQNILSSLGYSACFRDESPSVWGSAREAQQTLRMGGTAIIDVLSTPANKTKTESALIEAKAVMKHITRVEAIASRVEHR